MLGTVGRLEKKTAARDSRTHGAMGGRRHNTSGQGPRNFYNNSNGKQIRCFHCKKVGHLTDQFGQLKGNNSAPNYPNHQGSATRSLRPNSGSKASQYMIV